MYKKKFIISFVLILIVNNSACTGASLLFPKDNSQQNPTENSSPTEQNGGPIVSPYIDVEVTGVDFRFLETDPVQVELTILGTLPDQCEYSFHSVENRNGMTVKITLDGIHPPNTECSQTLQSIEYVYLLGRDMPESERGFASGEYELSINGYQTTFTIE